MRNQEYVQALEKVFSKHANPVQAFGAKKYMLNHFEFLGTTTPVRRKLQIAFWNKFGFPDNNKTEAIVKALWKKTEREYQYFAMELLEKKLAQGYPLSIELTEYLILHKSWWDTVDFIAPKLAGQLLMKNALKRKQQAFTWMESGNTWLMRSSLLFQLKYKAQTDFGLLTGLIRKCSQEPEFFIRKAIGWALREYSRVSPDSVIEFVKTTRLSNLSKKEALKRISREESK